MKKNSKVITRNNLKAIKDNANECDANAAFV